MTCESSLRLYVSLDHKILTGPLAVGFVQGMKQMGIQKRGHDATRSERDECADGFGG